MTVLVPGFRFGALLGGALIALLAGCANGSVKRPAPNLFPHWQQLGEVERGWYSSHLQASGSAALPFSAEDLQVRLTWLRSRHNPIVITINCEDFCLARGALLAGKGGSKPGPVIQIEKNPLSKADERDLRDLADLVRSPDGAPRVAVSDQAAVNGARWVVELVDGRGYSAWETDGPINAPDGIISDLSLLVASYSGVVVPQDAFY